MNQVFISTVKYLRQNDDGSYKRMTESFLVNAVSFTDVEAQLNVEMVQRTKAEFLISSIKRANYHYVLTDDDGGTFYNVTAAYKVEQDNEKIKTVKINFLIEADDINKVNDIVSKVLSGSVSEFEVVRVSVSSVMHVLGAEQQQEA